VTAVSSGQPRRRRWRDAARRSFWPAFPTRAICLQKHRRRHWRPCWCSQTRCVNMCAVAGVCDLYEKSLRGDQCHAHAEVCFRACRCAMCLPGQRREQWRRRSSTRLTPSKHAFRCCCLYPSFLVRHMLHRQLRLPSFRSQHHVNNLAPLGQVRTPEGLLKTWRKATRQYPFDFHVGPHRIVHARNVLISGARQRLYAGSHSTAAHAAIVVTS